MLGWFRYFTGALTPGLIIIAGSFVSNAQALLFHAISLKAYQRIHSFLTN